MSEVEATLQAALVDLAGSLTVRNGRLVRPLSHSGFGPKPHVEFVSPADDVQERLPQVGDELAARRGRAAATADPPERGYGPGLRSVPDLSVPAEHADEAIRNLRRAEEELAAAESTHWQREFELADAAAAVEAANDRLTWLDTQRIEARRDKVKAQGHLSEAQERQHEAVVALADARRRLDIARQAAGPDRPVD
jgi:hypothetical protein